jgi:hypothetical protein
VLVIGYGDLECFYRCRAVLEGLAVLYAIPHLSKPQYQVCHASYLKQALNDGASELLTGGSSDRAKQAGRRIDSSCGARVASRSAAAGRVGQLLRLSSKQGDACVRASDLCIL